MTNILWQRERCWLRCYRFNWQPSARFYPADGQRFRGLLGRCGGMSVGRWRRLCAYHFIPVHPIVTCSDIFSLPRAITFFLAHSPPPLSKTLEIPSTSHMAAAKSQETSSLITSTSVVWLWINMFSALLFLNLKTSPTTLPSSMV